MKQTSVKQIMNGRWESVKRRAKEGTHPNPRDWQCLNEEHVLGPARCVNVNNLRFHLMIDHGINTKSCKTPKDFGRLHLLAHALLAHPDLRELIGGNALLWEYK
jgi:hypothetical protein